MGRQKKIASEFEPCYKLEISQRQAELIQVAANIYARLAGGQFKLIDHLFWDKKGSLEKAGPHLEALQLIKNGSLNSFPGIAQIKDDYRILYDLHQVIRNRLAWDRDPKGDLTVDFDDPHQVSDAQPLAKIESVSKK